MTMHLMGPQYSTTSTRKRKKKLTDNQHTKMCIDWVAYNQQMKKMGCKTKTLDEYIAYRQGKYKPEKNTALPSLNKIPSYKSDHRDKYPSGDGIGTTYARKEKVYTGTLIKGIATMHKSNAVPIINKEQAIDIANMRRG
jgi:hypothetical protein